MPAPTYTAKHSITLSDGRAAYMYEYADGRLRVAVRGARYDIVLAGSATGDNGTNVMLRPAEEG